MTKTKEKIEPIPAGQPGPGAYDPEVEAGLLGAVLFRPELLVDFADKITPRDFVDSRHQKIYRAIDRLYQENRKIDILVVANELKKTKELAAVGGKEYLSSLIVDLLTAETVQEYADIIRQASQRRQLAGVARQIAEFSKDHNKKSEEIIELAEKELFKVSGQTVEEGSLAISELLDQKWDRLEKLKEAGGQIRGLATGLSDLDKKLSGLHPSDLFILAARPAMGKTSFALNIAYNIAKNKQPVLFFSLEMSQDQIMDRLLSLTSGIDAWRIRNADLSNQDFDRLNQALGSLSETDLLVDDAVGLTISQLKTKIRRQHHKQPVSLVVVDYLQLMSGSQTGREGNRVYEISEISRGLKLIARELNIPVMVLSQLNRSVETREGRDKRPQLSDLRDSGAIEQDADVVACLYRDDYYNPETSKKPNVVEVLIRKHRNGATGAVDVYFDRDMQRYLTLEKHHLPAEDLSPDEPSAG